MKKSEIEKFRDGIYDLQTTRFGTVAEIMIMKIYGFTESGNRAFDKKDSKSLERIEIKFSRCLRKNKVTITTKNVIKQCLEANYKTRALTSAQAETIAFDSNIQQVKRKEFDVLYYGLFFLDKIQIFKVTKDEIDNFSNYSDKQHRGNVGEGQFHLTKGNLKFHRERYLDKELTYEELYDLLKEK